MLHACGSIRMGICGIASDDILHVETLCNQTMQAQIMLRVGVLRKWEVHS